MSSQYLAQALSNAPIRFYRLNSLAGGTAHDSGSQGQDGAVNGGIVSGPGLITGLGDSSFSFDGSSGYVSCPTSGLPTGANHWSIDAWVNMPTVPHSGLHSIVEFGSPVSNEAAALFIDANGHLCTNTYAVNRITGPTAANGATYYVGASYDGTNLRLYVFSPSMANNGGLQGTLACTPAIALTYCYIGTEDSPRDDFYGGYGQAVGIYGAALSGAQFAANFQAGIAANPMAFAKRKGLWR